MTQDPLKQRPHLLVVISVAAVIVASLIAVTASGAFFTSQSSSQLRVNADRIQNWLNLYSESTDPDGDTGYALRSGVTPPTPAATGSDENLAVDLGVLSSNNVTFNRVFTLKVRPSLPAGNQVTVTAYVLPDPQTGRQPIRSIGFSPLSPGGGFTNPCLMNAGQKYQLNLVVHIPPGQAGSYNLGIRLTLTYAGYSGSFYQYLIPVKVAR